MNADLVTAAIADQDAAADYIRLAAFAAEHGDEDSARRYRQAARDAFDSAARNFAAVQ